MVAGTDVRTGPAQSLADAARSETNGSFAESTEAVVLAGGHCWGENPLEQVVCRPLVPIAGRPLLMHTLEWLRRAGITRVSICVNHEARQIRRLLGNGSGLGIELNYFEDVMPRGPAGCARDVAGQSDARRFLVLEGTILPRLDLHELLGASRQSVLTVVATPARTGLGGKGRFFAPAGMYIFSRAAFTHVPEAGYQDIKETLIPRLHVSGERVDTLVVDARNVLSVSGLGSYLGVCHQALETLTHQPPIDGYLRVDQALIHRSARIHASVRLVGPVLVSPDVELGAGSIVVGPATIGARTRIGPGCVVCRSVLWSDCLVEERTVLDQCIVTGESVVRAGRELRHSVVVPHQRRMASSASQALAASAGDLWLPEPGQLPEPSIRHTAEAPQPAGERISSTRSGETLSPVKA